MAQNTSAGKEGSGEFGPAFAAADALECLVGSDEFAAVDRGSVPQPQDFPGNLAVQCLEESDHLRALDRAGMRAEVNVAQGQSDDRREARPLKLKVRTGVWEWRAQVRPVRPLAKPAFVEEDEGVALAEGFFSDRGAPVAAPGLTD